LPPEGATFEPFRLGGQWPLGLRNHVVSKGEIRRSQLTENVAENEIQKKPVFNESKDWRNPIP